MRRFILIIILTALSIGMGFIVEPSVNELERGVVVDFAMNNDESFYTLNYEEKNDMYTLIKISSSGEVEKLVDLEKSTENSYSYRQLHLDEDANIYVLREEINKPKEISLHNEYGIVKEEVLKYGKNGESLGCIGSIDFSNEDELPVSQCMNWVQVVGKNLYSVYNKNNFYQVFKFDINGASNPVSVKDFSLDSPKSDETWLSDVVYTSTSNVICVDKRGKMFMIGENGEITNISDIIGEDVVPSMLSIDKVDNVYFTDVNTGSFYSFNVSTMSVNKYYDKDSVINDEKDVKVSDVNYIFVAQNGLCYAMVKSSNENAFVGFGSSQVYVEKVTYQKYIRALEIAIISVLTFAVLFIIYCLYRYITRKFTVLKRVVLWFTPAYVILLSVVMVGTSYIMLSNYKKEKESNQRNGIKVVDNAINVGTLNSLNMLDDYLTDDYKSVKNSTDLAFDLVRDFSDEMIVYVVRDDRIYYAMDNYLFRKNLQKRDNVDLEFVNLARVPIEYVKSEKVVSQYYDMWNKLKVPNYNGDDVLHYEDKSGKWISVVLPIRSENGEASAFIESRFSENIKYSNLYVMEDFIVDLAIIVVGVILYVYLMFVLKHSLKALKVVKSGIVNISKGDWTKKLPTDSKDEFAYICKSLNEMTDNVYQRMSEMLLLNEEYIKYTPREVLALLNKNKITQVALDEVVNQKLAVLSLTLDKACECGIQSDSYLKDVQEAFDSIFIVAEKNNGVVKNFDDFKMTILFSGGPIDAVRASMQLKNIFEDERINEKMHMVLCYGDVFVGAVGNTERIFIPAVSSDILLMKRLEENISLFSANHVALESVINDLHTDEKYEYRLIGQVKDYFTQNPVKVYEFIGGKGSVTNNLFITTKQEFENGVNAYCNGDFVAARQSFAVVLSKNNEDVAAMRYLKLCEDAQNIWKNDKMNGFMFD